MPLPQGTKYRYKKGTKLRLAFAPKSGEVVEAKNMMTGATHTPMEMMADRKKKKKGSLKKSMMGH